MSYRIRFITPGKEKVTKRNLRFTGIDEQGVEILLGKSKIHIIRVEGLTAPAANILKQQLLSLGADAAVHRDAIGGETHDSPTLILSDERRLKALPSKLDRQPFKLKSLAEDIVKLLDKIKNRPTEIPLPNGSIDLKEGPIIMGILNVTPDSFSDGGLYTEVPRAVERALKMVEEGASIIDIGGESSRPGAAEVNSIEEKARVVPVIEKLVGKLSVPISIDTRKSDVAETALKAGAAIINDISALRHDNLMSKVAAEYGAAVVAMHMKGTPENMQKNPFYEDVITEIFDWLGERTDELIDAGIEREKIIIDPGIGFGKRLEDNLDIVSGLSDFRSLGFPIMVGHSRKSFIGTIIGNEPGERVAGGLAALGKMLDGGAQIIRGHDTKETADYIKVWKKIREREEPL